MTGPEPHDRVPPPTPANLVRRKSSLPEIAIASGITATIRKGVSLRANWCAIHPRLPNSPQHFHIKSRPKLTNGRDPFLEIIDRIIYKNADDIAVSIGRSFERLEEHIDVAESRL